MSGPPEPVVNPDAVAPAAAWPSFFQSVLYSRELRPWLAPMPAEDNPAHPTVRAMQRGRRHAWLHARYQLHLSMFESIRISVRLAEAFAEWTHAATGVDALARRLEEVEHEARRPWPVSQELRFVDQLMRAASTTDLELAEMEIALAASHSVDVRAAA